MQLAGDEDNGFCDNYYAVNGTTGPETSSGGGSLRVFGAAASNGQPSALLRQAKVNRDRGEQASRPDSRPCGFSLSMQPGKLRHCNYERLSALLDELLHASPGKARKAVASCAQGSWSCDFGAAHAALPGILRMIMFLPQNVELVNALGKLSDCLQLTRRLQLCLWLAQADAVQ